MYQQALQLLLLIAVIGMALSVVAFVISIFSPSASDRLTNLTVKLAIPVHVLLATAVLAKISSLGAFYPLEQLVDGFSR